MLSTCLRTQLINLFRQGSKSIAQAQLKWGNVTQRLYSKCLSKRMLEHCVVPDVISVPPNEHVIVYYEDTCVYAREGNILTPFQTRHEPVLKYSQLDACGIYTLCMTDPDVPTRAEPIFGEWHHWLVVNIPGQNISRGDVLSSYIGPAPRIRTGLHRYVFLLYRQRCIIACNEVRLSWNSGRNRGGFSISKFADKYDLGDPIGGNFFLAEYDDHVPYLHKQIDEK